jgi:hypothetical protein
MAKSDDYAAQDRQFAQRGDRYQEEARQRAYNQQQRRGWAQDYQAEQYDPMLAGQGGYNPQEAADIRGDYSGIPTTPEEFQSNYRTQQEQNDAVGNPWERAAYFNPEGMEAAGQSDSDRVRGSMGSYRSDMQGAMDPYAASMEAAIADQQGQSIDPRYKAMQDATIAQTGSDRRAAVDPSLLRADKAALDTIRMSPEEYQQTLDAAGNTVGESYRAAADDVARRTRAAGASALGMGAARERLERASAVDRGDAMLNAKVAAGAARAGRAGTAEDFRLRGEEGTSDRMGRAAMEAGDFEFKGRFGMEDQRLAAERAKQGTKLQVASELGKARLASASELGRAGIGVEEGAAQRGQQQRQYNATTGTEMATGIERDTTARKLGNTVDRQAVNQANQATRYGQGMGIQQAKTAGAQRVADKRIDAQYRGQDYLDRTQQQAAAEQGQEYDRGQNAWQTQGGMMQNTTNSQIQRDAQPKPWEKALGMVIGGAKAASGFKALGG